MSDSFETIASITSVIIALIAIWLSREGNRNSQRATTREATEAIFAEWWGEDMRELRKYFFLSFIPKYRFKCTGISLTEVEHVIADDKGQIMRLCHFFDRVGWLGAIGLIDVDYLMGAMQHVMRRVWMSTEPLIKKEQERNPVYHYGFEWLFRRSNKHNKHQAVLVGYKFRNPRILSKKQIHTLRDQINKEEVNFQLTLQNALMKPETKSKKNRTDR